MYGRQFNPTNHRHQSIRAFNGRCRSQTIIDKNLYPQNLQWRENLTNKNRDVNSSPNTEKTFWVTKTTDAEKLSQKLLEENFGFSKEDYETYVKKYGKLVISDERRCESAKTQKLSEKKTEAACSSTLPTDIKNWKTVGGKVSVDLGAETIKQIQNFKQERTIDEAVKKITDPFLRETVKNDLMALATGDAQARIDAAARLENLEVETFNDVEAVRDSIRTLSQTPLNKQNATIQILSAKVDLEKAVTDKHNAFVYDVNALGDKKNVNNQTLQKRVAEYESRLQKAIDAAGGVDTQTGKRLPNAKINRAEAAQANREMAKIYRALGEDDKADQREMLARFYQVDARERNTMEFKLGTLRISVSGTILSGGWFPKMKTAEMSSSNGNVPPPTQPNQTPKKELSESPFKFTYKVIDKIDNQGKIVRNENKQKVKDVNSTYQVEGSLKTKDDIKVSTFEYKDEKGRQVPEGMPYKIRNERKTTIPPPELNREGTTRSFVSAGRVAAIAEWNKLMTFAIESDKVTKKLAGQERAFFRNNYPIPPHPKDLPRMKLALEINYGKEKVAIMMKNIEEMSYAAYVAK